MKFRKLILPIIALAMLIFAASEIFSGDPAPSKGPAIAPFTSNYEFKVAGVGVVEPQSEIISISPHLEGVITKVYVKAGEKVTENAPLFTIDDRAEKAELASAVAQKQIAEINLQDAKIKFSYYKNLSDKKAVSKDEYSQREFAYKKANAELLSASALVKEIQTKIERLTVNSPINAEILKVNARQGEFAKTAASKPLMVIGDTSVMNVRVEIDETDAQRFKIKSTAKGSLRNQESQSTDLKFVRIEPLLNSKKNLTGEGSEVVDTRVMEVIYSFDNAKIKAFPGQQMDVFISSDD